MKKVDFRRELVNFVCWRVKTPAKVKFWQQNNHPIELSGNEMIDQKLDYIHTNPIEAGFVDEAEDYIYSSARDYSGIKGMVDLCLSE